MLDILNSTFFNPHEESIRALRSQRPSPSDDVPSLTEVIYIFSFHMQLNMISSRTAK